MTKDHIITALDGRNLSNFSLYVTNIAPGRFTEETNFEVYLKDQSGRLSNSCLIQGKYFSGRGKYYKPWLEIVYNNRNQTITSKSIDISKNKLDEKLFAYLTNILPLGSHIMVVYSNHIETREGLDRGIPAPATPLGYLLWKSGCTWFKNWYFSEGFWEGDIKLQGNIPPDNSNRIRNLRNIHQNLTKFLNTKKSIDITMKNAIERAKQILNDIEKELKLDRYQ